MCNVVGTIAATMSVNTMIINLRNHIPKNLKNLQLWIAKLVEVSILWHMVEKLNILLLMTISLTLCKFQADQQSGTKYNSICKRWKKPYHLACE